MSHAHAKTCADCGRTFFADRSHCRECAPRHTPTFECERCGFVTYEPLTERDGELQCSRCLTREPDPTPEEIYAEAARIRAERPDGWEMD